MPNAKIANIMGPAGRAYTITAEDFTVPAAGETVDVTVEDDTSWIAVGEMLWIAEAGGPGIAGTLQVQAKTENTLTLLNPPISPAFPLADPVTDGLLKKVSGLSTDFVDGTNACQDLATAVKPTIWSVRSRGVNVVGNCNFDVDQRSINVPRNIAGSGQFICDRWSGNEAGSMVIGAVADNYEASSVVLPGFGRLSSAVLKLQVNTAQASLGTNDFFHVQQNFEGPQFRPLIGNPHSLSLLVKSTVAPVTFAVVLLDSPVTKQLVKMATVTTANVPTIIRFPNLPPFPSGNFSPAPQKLGYLMRICVAAGSGYITNTPDVWVAQTASILGTSGLTNFAGFPVNSQFYVQYVQHEPGPECTPIPLLDKLFSDNLDECLRFFQKSYPYNVALGTVGASSGQIAMLPWTPGGGAPYGNVFFRKIMAKIPTLTTYSPPTGLLYGIRSSLGAVDYTVTSTGGLSDAGFCTFALNVYASAATVYTAQYVADTGW